MYSASLKAQLRISISEEIASLPDDYIIDSNYRLLSAVTAHKAFIDASNIMLYFSIKREPDTIEIIRAALQTGKTVALPYCYRGGVMQARIAENLDSLKPAMLGIPAPPDSAPILAPEKLDLVIVPALAFDQAGHRLGYGGGYYDRFLSGIQAYTLGLTRERLIKRKLPVEPHDISVKCIITEAGTRFP